MPAPIATGSETSTTSRSCVLTSMAELAAWMAARAAPAVTTAVSPTCLATPAPRRRRPPWTTRPTRTTATAPMVVSPSSRTRSWAGMSTASATATLPASPPAKIAAATSDARQRPVTRSAPAARSGSRPRRPSGSAAGRGVPEPGVLPHLLQELTAREHLARVADQEQQQLELPRGQGDRAPGDLGLPGRRVDHHVAGVHAALLGRRVAPGAAEHAADSGDQLPRAERLHHVVVRAELEPDDPVGLVAAGGQHHDRDRRAGAEPPAHLEAVHAGQHQVQHDQVGRCLGGEREPQRLLPVAGHGHAIAAELQVARDHLAHGRLVVDHQHQLATHASMLPAATTSAKPRRRDRTKFVSTPEVDRTIQGRQAPTPCEPCSPAVPGSSAATWPTRSPSAATRWWWSTGCTRAPTPRRRTTSARTSSTCGAAWTRRPWTRRSPGLTPSAIRRPWSGSGAGWSTPATTSATTTSAPPSCWRRSTAGRRATGPATCGRARASGRGWSGVSSSRPARAAAASWLPCRSARTRRRTRATCTRRPSCTRSTWRRRACTRAGPP